MNGAKKTHMCCDAVFLQQRFLETGRELHFTSSRRVLSDLREMELQRVVGAQADIQSGLEELLQRIPLIRQEKRVVAQRAHRNPDLLQVKQIL